MRKIQRWSAAVLALALLSAGCEKTPVQEQTRLPTVQPTQAISGDTSLAGLRQTMGQTPRLAAVAYFGYQQALVSFDPIAVLEESAPELCAQMTFLREISPDRIIGQSGDLFCIVPRDADATVAVSKGYWDAENQCYIYDDMLYSSNTGDPILLLCNNSGWEPDCQLYISGPSGEMFWYPRSEEPERMGRFLMKPEVPEPTRMAGSWELAWTEVEGYQTDEEQGSRKIEIFSDASGDLVMSYACREFPQNDFECEPMILDQREMYFGCGNREWVADLNIVGPYGAVYTVTLTQEDILIKQNYFMLDGAPTVSYEYYRRTAEPILS